MLDILGDIRRRLKAGEYKNEEHVRLALVAGSANAQTTWKHPPGEFLEKPR